ncbi:unnamed protein product, partial [Ectocarpus sp. 13 AM-2016]
GETAHGNRARGRRCCCRGRVRGARLGVRGPRCPRAGRAVSIVRALQDRLLQPVREDGVPCYPASPRLVGAVCDAPVGLLLQASQRNVPGGGSHVRACVGRRPRLQESRDSGKCAKIAL